MLVALTAALAYGGQSRISLNASDSQLTATRLDRARPGFSGTGYATGFTSADSKIAWRVRGVPGVYAVHIRYSSPNGLKGYDLAVNGSHISGLFAATGDNWSVADAGRVELKPGDNVIEIDRGWGWFDVDSVALDLAPAPTRPPMPPPTLADPRAEPQTRDLFAMLRRLYGHKTLSGQQGLEDCDYVKQQTGSLPAIAGDDFMDYSPSRVAFGSKPKDLTERMIEAARKGQIVTMMWHWNAPTGLINKMFKDAQGRDVNALWYKGFYSNATKFDLAQAISNPGSPDYRLLLRDIDAIADELSKFDRAGIPVLWRPLHEAEGGWFWWGAKGPEAFKKLWRLMFHRLTVDRGLHNLIWVYSSGTDPDWYPGDDVVDIIGIDAYPSDQDDPLGATWDTLETCFKGKKLLALTEFGGVPDPDRMRRLGSFWSYFVSWSGSSREPARLNQIYREAQVQCAKTR